MTLPIFEKYLIPDIIGFDTLISSFGGRFIFNPKNLIVDNGHDATGLGGECARMPNNPIPAGIPFGATLLISGPPGAGKTTFALEMARGLMRFPPVFAGSDSRSRKPVRPLVFYISPEITQERLKEMFADMGWFDENESGLFRTDNPIPDEDTLYTVVPLPDVDRPVPSAEELVNGIFSQISRAISPSEAPHEPKPVIVIVDSVTALLKGCVSEHEERRQTHEILHRLRSLFGRNYLALTVLLAEQDFGTASHTRVPAIEDYLAEIVFHLDLKSAPLGRRVRTLEIVKSQGVNMILGEHSWEIITNKNATGRFRHPKIAREVEKIACRGEDKPNKWGTIAIFSRPTIQNPTSEIYSSDAPLELLQTGTAGLDEMLDFAPQYWVRRPNSIKFRKTKSNHSVGAIKAGSTTLICGPVGCGKTSLCIQFLVESAAAEIRKGRWERLLNVPSSEQHRIPGPRAVLFTFDRSAQAAAREALLLGVKHELCAYVSSSERIREHEGIVDLTLAFTEFIFCILKELDSEDGARRDKRGTKISLMAREKQLLAMAYRTAETGNERLDMTSEEKKRFETYTKQFAGFVKVKARKIKQKKHSYKSRNAPILKDIHLRFKKHKTTFQSRGEFLEKRSLAMRIAARLAPEAREMSYIKRQRDFADLIDGILKPFFDPLLDRWFAVLDFTQSHFDYNTLCAHVLWVRDWWKPDRIAFDGLSEWQTMYNREEAAKMLEALMVSVRTARLLKDEENSATLSSYTPLTIFMTYELPDGGDPLAPQALGVTAGNIVAVRMINVHDQLNRIIYVLKAETNNPDQNVRELYLSLEDKRVEVRAGLDLFTGLLKGEPRSADVTLQLFQENKAEKAFNEWIFTRLKKTRTLNFKLIEFSRGEISTMHEHVTANKRMVPADVTIQSVDEWWLSHAGANAPFLNIHDLWTPPEEPESQDLGPSWKNFWALEVRKAGPPPLSESISIADATNFAGQKVLLRKEFTPKVDEESIQRDRTALLLAVPGYVDFGMFCINLGLTRQSGLTARENVSKTYEHILKAMECFRKMRDEGAQVNSDAELQKFTREAMEKVWRKLLDAVPPYWAKVEAVGGERYTFAGNAETLFGIAAELGANLRSETGEEIWFFSFDTETRETVVCMFFELAWAFGAPEGFLANHSDEAKKGAKLALLWLQHMVAKGWMPERGTVETSRRSLFSRQFYSTLQSANDFPGRQDNGSIDDNSRINRADGRAALFPQLVALPFFPSGSSDTGGTLASLHQDLISRIRDLLNRFSWPVSSQCVIDRELQQRLVSLQGILEANPWLEGEVVRGLSEKQAVVLVKLVNELIAIVKEERQTQKERDTHSKNTVESSGEILNDPVRGFDIDDLTFMLRLNLMRLQKLVTDKKRPEFESRATSLEIEEREPLAFINEEMKFWRPANLFVPSGYSAAGSWFYGVHKATRSPSLAFDILQELTSLEAAEYRAKIGAGLPSRKDFYHLHRNDVVPGMPYLSWEKFYRYNCSRTRQREKAIPRGVPPGPIYKIICEEVHRCLSHAARNRVASGDIAEQTIQSLNKQADASLENIMLAINEWSSSNQIHERNH